MKFQVENMTCGHCVKAVTNAILEQDSNAVVNVDLEQKLVSVESNLTAEQIIACLAEEEYPAKLI